MLYKLKRFFIAIPLGIAHFFVRLYHGIINLILKIGRNFKEIGRQFAHGNLSVKLSFFFMGFGCLANRQIIKGLIYLLIEVAFILFIVFFGAAYIGKLGTLGTVAMGEVIGPDGMPVFTEIDNSFKILLYGLLSIMVCVFFLIVYFASIKSSYKAYELKASGAEIPKFRKELMSLLNEKYHTTMLTLPAIGVLLFTVLPLILMILIAFTNFDNAHQPPGNLFSWVGFENFANMLNMNGQMGQTFVKLFGWTIIWAVFATFTNYIFGMLLAILINKKGIRLKKMWRTIFVITVAVPQFVTLMLMSKVLADEGIVNALLQRWGWISTPIPFLSNPMYAKITVIVVNMWIGIPYTMLITTGILMNIPADLYESARIDGASPVKMFMRITLPYMLFVTGPYLITQFMGNINNFNVIFLLTGGGPNGTDLFQAGHTDLLVTWLYKLTVNLSDYNAASTIGIMIFMICSVLSLITYNNSSAVKKEEEFQ